MKQFLAMLGISLLAAGGLLPIQAEARVVRSEPVQVLDRELIRDAQRQLKALGFNPGAVDGNFGSQTEAALRAYQQAYRLPETGKLDEATVRSLRPEQKATSPAPINFSDRRLISRVQIQLKTLGFDPGTVDGELGQQTEAALQAYQHAHRLPETGRLDEVTLRSLLPQMREGALR
jgi:peptidoglycan hydrolase-like protein with peptidoglycan-binding domain